MRRISKLLVFAILLNACSPATGGCRGGVVTTVMKMSGGPAPYRMMTVEAYGNGCVRYTSVGTVRCLCQDSDALRSALASPSVEEVVALLRIAPRTMHDVETISVDHRDIGAARPARDLPKNARLWLSTLDEALRLLVGPSYEPFLNGDI